MKIRSSIIPIITIFILTFLTLQSCGNDEETVSCFPKNSINVVLNLNLPAYQSLQTTGGWMYINEQSSGNRGLIIVRTNGGFKVYDRNAPHICPNDNTTLKVINDIKITCPSDAAEWILLTGEPIKTAQIAPKTYAYSFDYPTNTLSVVD